MKFRDDFNGWICFNEDREIRVFIQKPYLEVLCWVGSHSCIYYLPNDLFDFSTELGTDYRKSLRRIVNGKIAQPKRRVKSVVEVAKILISNKVAPDVFGWKPVRGVLFAPNMMAYCDCEVDANNRIDGFVIDDIFLEEFE